jgi:hypothetical protein
MAGPIFHCLWIAGIRRYDTNTMVIRGSVTRVTVTRVITLVVVDAALKDLAFQLFPFYVHENIVYNFTAIDRG